jgi:hypothetical protein
LTNFLQSIETGAQDVVHDVESFGSKLVSTIKTDASAIGGWIEQGGEDVLLGAWNIGKGLVLQAEPKLMQDGLNLMMDYVLHASPAQKSADVSALEADFNTFIASAEPAVLAEIQALGSDVVQGLLKILIGLLTTGKLVLPAAV